MLNKFPFHKAHVFFICMVIVGVFFAPAINSIGMGLLVINWLVEGDLKSKWNKLVQSKIFWVLLSVFFIHLIGLIYTSNFQYALKDLKIKLPIFILPFVFISSKQLSESEFKVVLKTLIFTALVSSFYAFYIYWKYFGNEITELRNISTFMSHIRLGLFNCFAAFSCIYLIAKNNWKQLSFTNLIWFSIAIWMFAFNGIMGTRMGILVFFILIAIGCFYVIIKQKKLWLTAILILFVFGLPIASYFGIPAIKQRADEVVSEVNNYRKGGSANGQSIGQRFVYWKVGVEIFKSAPIIGIGTGDVEDAYNNYYLAHPNLIDKEYQHRAHNQFLTIALTFGIIGLLVFIYAIVYPIFWNKKYLDYFYVIFFVAFLLSITMEDTIETQAGVTFYAFFNCLFLFAKPNEWLD